MFLRDGQVGGWDAFTVAKCADSESWKTTTGSQGTLPKTASDSLKTSQPTLSQGMIKTGYVVDVADNDDDEMRSSVS
jgi:hypothetical protein